MPVSRPGPEIRSMRFGPRTPLIVISPGAKVNLGSHALTAQSVITQFFEENWGSATSATARSTSCPAPSCRCLASAHGAPRWGPRPSGPRSCRPRPPPRHRHGTPSLPIEQAVDNFPGAQPVHSTRRTASCWPNCVRGVCLLVPGFGVGKDGCLFRGENGSPIQPPTYWQVWQRCAVSLYPRSGAHGSAAPSLRPALLRRRLCRQVSYPGMTVAM
jgi:hypothetical protein